MEDLAAFIDQTTILYPLLWVLIPGLLLLSALLLVWYPLRRIQAYYRLQKRIRHLGQAYIGDAYLPGGIEGHIYIEHLALTPQGLLLVHVKPYYGSIFAGEQIDFWTQVIGHRSFKFTNPLHALQATLGELRSVMPKVPIEGRVLFTAGSQFPKGKPEQIVSLENLNDLASQYARQPIPEGLMAFWQDIAVRTQHAGQQHIESFLQRGDKRRIAYGLLLLGLALAWGVWAWYASMV